MRIKLLMLAAMIASLAATSRAPAALSLQWFKGQQNFGTNGVPPGDPTNPQSLIGLGNFQTIGANATAISSVTLPTVGNQIILKIMLVDTFTGYGTGTPTTANPTGSGYTFPDNNSVGLFQFAMKVTFNPTVASVIHDPVSADGISNTYTVNGGGNFGTVAGTNANLTSSNGTGSPNENAAFANNAPQFGANFVTLGNILFSAARNNEQNDLNFGPWSNPDLSTNPAPTYRFALANLVLTATGPGVGSILLSLPGTPPPSFSNSNAQSLDTDVWGPTLSNTFSLPVTVVAPEPSSMVLAGLVVSGIGYRLRRKKVAEVTV